jgi:hypothetical protein
MDAQTYVFYLSSSHSLLFLLLLPVRLISFFRSFFTYLLLFGLLALIGFGAFKLLGSKVKSYALLCCSLGEKN